MISNTILNRLLADNRFAIVKNPSKMEKFRSICKCVCLVSLQKRMQIYAEKMPSRHMNKDEKCLKIAFNPQNY